MTKLGVVVAGVVVGGLAGGLLAFDALAQAHARRRRRIVAAARREAAELAAFERGREQGYADAHAEAADPLEELPEVEAPEDARRA